MPAEHLHLLIAALLWLALHIGVAGTGLRGRIAAAVGENGFRGLFTLASLVIFAALVWTYGRASGPQGFYGLWVVEPWMYWVPFLVMPVALLLFVGAVSTPNPTAVGAEKALLDPTAVRGINRITRHPMLWSFVLWAVAHTFANGDLASVILFATVAVTALVGMPSIDAKRRARDPVHWDVFAAKTSIVPFAAILAGRNRFVPGEIGWRRLAIALLAWAVILAVHPFVIGVSPLPPF